MLSEIVLFEVVSIFFIDGFLVLFFLRASHLLMSSFFVIVDLLFGTSGLAPHSISFSLLLFHGKNSERSSAVLPPAFANAFKKSKYFFDSSPTFQVFEIEYSFRKIVARSQSI